MGVEIGTPHARRAHALLASEARFASSPNPHVSQPLLVLPLYATTLLCVRTFCACCRFSGARARDERENLTTTFQGQVESARGGGGSVSPGSISSSKRFRRERCRRCTHSLARPPREPIPWAGAIVPRVGGTYRRTRHNDKRNKQGLRHSTAWHDMTWDVAGRKRKACRGRFQRGSGISYLIGYHAATKKATSTGRNHDTAGRELS